MSAERSVFVAASPLRKVLFSCVSVLPLMFLAQEVQAQVVPGSAQPEHVGQRFQTAPVPPKRVGDYVTAPETATVPVSGSLSKQLTKTFVLKGVQIEESTAYPAGTFDALFASKIGQKTTVEELRVIARAITTQYRKDGYVLSQAVIPPQSLKDGVFRVRVVEGFVDKVVVNMDNPDADRRGLIKAYGEKISQLRPFNTNKLERYMLLANDLPGMKARALLRPSSGTFGAADLVIEVTTKTVGASFTADNRGNKYTGPYQGQATVTENSLAGLGERTTIRGVNTVPTREMHFFDIQHEEQVGSEGTRVIARAGFTRTRPGDALKALDIAGSSDNYALTVSHPFIRSRATNLTGHATFETRDSESTAIGTRLNNDRVRALRGGLSYDAGDAFDGVNLLSAEASQGVSWFDATSAGAGRSNTAANFNFLKLNLDASRVQSLPYGFSVLTAATGQVSANPLPSSEKLSLGGVGFGQAYDSGEVSGDQGLAGRVEVRFGQPVGYRYLDSYQLYTYYDIGTVFERAAAASTPKQQSLASLGAGVRANLNENFYGYLEVGAPLTHKIASENNYDPRVFFSVTGRY